MNHPASAPPRPDPAAIRRALAGRLDADARAWLDTALAEAAEGAGAGPLPAWERRFAEAGRRAGAAHADTARVLLLHAAGADAGTLTRLYREGSGAERRAVLDALTLVVPGPEAVPLVEDALRANDTGIVAAAVGPYAARHLDAHPWRHAVLKCLFTGVPLTAVAGLAERAAGDGELDRMLADFAEERAAAGRAVPADLTAARALTGAAPTGRPTTQPAGGGAKEN
ncbi:EboA domain-containing protein [Streptomyces diastaticus]|uniref:EboA domain-containing protein n=1 Tax=Streptomyces sp. BRB081 TaxID=2769544 RepID=UPI0018ACCA72|nr:EboA domain-containing protein [Streptomyces sp. BRB081]MBL3803480.1 EboA domain-containing protein [Streptomyces sp. BRB081]